MTEVVDVAKQFHNLYWDHLRRISGMEFKNVRWGDMNEHRDATIAAFHDLVSEGVITVVDKPT